MVESNEWPYTNKAATEPLLTAYSLDENFIIFWDYYLLSLFSLGKANKNQLDKSWYTCAKYRTSIDLISLFGDVDVTLRLMRILPYHYGDLLW